MRTAERIKGILASAGLSYEEFGKLIDLSRQSIHTYFRPDVHLEDFEGGIRCINMSKKLLALCETKELPLSSDISKDAKIDKLKELVGRDKLKVQP